MERGIVSLSPISIVPGIYSLSEQPGGTRIGELSLRQQRLTGPMLDALRTDIVRVAMELVEYEDGNNAGEGNVLLPSKNGKVTAFANKFIYLRARITNMTSTSNLLLLATLLTV